MSIAAYRDPELIPTIEDCLAKARSPERLRFGICWQHGPEEAASERFGDPAFRVLDVEWRASRGACWARAEIMKLWDCEDWFLQLDSHHRFVADWDLKLLDQALATGSPKPILTTYAGPFTPGDAGSLSPEPMRMEFDRFTEDGLVLFRPGMIPQWTSTTRPVRSRFISAHFLFAPGQFVRDVPYDPSLYFIGEEITLAVRAYTHGYDLFHPGEAIVWHEYTRNYRPKHWDDHVAARGVDIEWTQRDGPSRKNASRLLTVPETGPFGCGSDRSVADYEAFSGINFIHRRVQDYTRHHHEPPNPPLDADWIAATRDHTVRIGIAASELESTVWTESEFWCVVVRDAAGADLLRADADREEIGRLLAGSPETVSLVRRFESTVDPAGWSVRPSTVSQGWLDPIEGELVRDGSGEWLSGSMVALMDGTHAFAPEDQGLLARYPRVVPGLGWAETEGGFVVTQVGRPGRIAVNRTGVLILELANGRYSGAEVAEVVGKAFSLPAAPCAEVAMFLSSAARGGIVEMYEQSEGEPDE